MTEATRGTPTPADHGSRTREARGEITIQAPPETVWRALTEARELEAWFPLEARVEPGADGRIWMSWGHEYAEEMRIEAWDPPRHLRTTWGWGDDSPQITDYRLEGKGGQTTVRVVTSGFPAGSSWDDLVEGTRLGWLFELAQLKHYLEHHAGAPRRAVFLRRRVSLERAEAWARLTGPDGVDLDGLARSVVDHTPPWQFAAVVDDPTDGLLRLTVDPTHTDPGLRDVTVWVAGWGVEPSTMEAVAERWSRRLAELFPEGEARDMQV